jgi:hypothetical protein
MLSALPPNATINRTWGMGRLSLKAHPACAERTDRRRSDPHDAALGAGYSCMAGRLDEIRSLICSS